MMDVLGIQQIVFSEVCIRQYLNKLVPFCDWQDLASHSLKKKNRFGFCISKSKMDWCLLRNRLLNASANLCSDNNLSYTSMGVQKTAWEMDDKQDWSKDIHALDKWRDFFVWTDWLYGMLGSS